MSESLTYSNSVFLGAVTVASQSHTFKSAADPETIQSADTVEELKITSPRLFFSLPLRKPISSTAGKQEFSRAMNLMKIQHK